MMSKNLFLANLRENNKRRVWLWLVSFLFWFFYYPVAIALLMNRKTNHNLIDGLTGDLAKHRLTDAAEGWLSLNSAAFIFVSLMAVICAIQGFAYLYSRKKVDMYHSVPVKKSRRFAVIFVNGILIYAVPYFVCMLTALAVAGVYGGMDTAVARTAMISLFMNFVLFMGTYSLTMIAVMLTGTLIITVFATVIFLVYEIAVRMILVQFQSQFFDYYSYNSSNISPLFSPAGQYLKIAEVFGAQGSNMGAALSAQANSIVIGIVLAVIFTFVAYFCYIKRPSEAAGKAMAFAVTKPAVKLFLTVPAALTAGLVVMDIVGDNSTLMVILGMAAATVLGNCMIEVIYEMDIRAALRKKYQILVSGAFVAVIYCIFFFDLTGFDAWVPEKDKLENAVVVFTFDAYNRNYIDQEFNYLTAEDYYLTQPGITDTEAICELSSKKIDNESLEELPDKEHTIWCEIAYRMKSGKVVWREFLVSSGEEELLNRIIGSREYKEEAYQIYNDEFFEMIKENTLEGITYNNGFSVKNLPPEELEVVRELYIKDSELMDYTTLKDEFMCGTIEINVQKENDYTKATWLELGIYPSYTNTIHYLREKGIDVEPIKAENVASITITNYHDEMRNQKEYGDWEEYPVNTMEYEDFSVTETFTEEKQVQELINALYPSVFSSDWKESGVISEDYYVTIQYKGEKIDSSYYRGNNSAYLITERIPQWVEKETAYK